HSAMAETLLERGDYLVNGIANCGNCHSPRQVDGTQTGPALSGGTALTAARFTAYPPNLTPDPETGLGRWTEAQIVTALREGRTLRGERARPAARSPPSPPNPPRVRKPVLGGGPGAQIGPAPGGGPPPGGGVRRPPMPIPFYRGIPDRDARAIAVYLRSLAP